MKQATLFTALTCIYCTSALYSMQSDTLMIKASERGKIDLSLQKSGRDRIYCGPDIFWSRETPHIRGIHIKDNSLYYGLKAGYDFLKPQSFYAGIHALYAMGRMHIKAEADKTKIYQDHVKGVFANGEIRFGYNFFKSFPFFITPFVGIGGYHVRPFSSIRYVHDWLYGAVGVKAEYEFTPNFNAGLNLKGTRAFYFEQRFKKSSYSESIHKSSNVLGYEISVPLTLRIGNQGYWDLRFEPYFLKLNSHSHSNIVGSEMTFSVRY